MNRLDENIIDFNGEKQTIFFISTKLKRILLFSLLLISLPIVYLFVYSTGGIKYVYSHTMYLPIIIASIFLGVRGGIPIAFLGGILLGPLMPLDISTGEKQILINWLYRMIYFQLTAIIIGLFSDSLRKKINTVKYMSTHNYETGIDNIYGLYFNDDVTGFLKERNDIIIIAVTWNNYQNILDTFGRETCGRIISSIYEEFLEVFSEKIRILQSDFNKLFFCINGEDDLFYLNQVIHLLNKPYVIQGIPYYVEFSAGLASRHKDKIRDISAFKQAEIASYHAHHLKVPHMFFSPDLLTTTKKNLLLLGEFPDALKKEDLYLVFQPKMSFKSERIIGLEALLRWNHKDKGLIMPDDFIPLVEESQLIHPLTEFVLEKVLDTIGQLSNYDVSLPISINISPKNLQNPRFLEQITAILDNSKENSSLIEFEITETALMTNPDKVVYLLEYLKNYKITLSIDDFGTGYSSLSYLNRFPVDNIKIDKFFSQNIINDRDIEKIVTSTIDLSHKLGMKVIAEGIEDKEIADKLIELGCDMGQGFLYYKPLGCRDLFELLETAKIKQ